MCNLRLKIYLLCKMCNTYARTAPQNAIKNGRAALGTSVHTVVLYISYLSSSLVRGNSTVSRILDMPVTYIIMRSSPSPNPLCGTLPNRRRSR